MKRGWYRNKETGEVVFLEGSGSVKFTSIVRHRNRSFSAVFDRVINRDYEPLKTSGFPSTKPKNFKPRYAVYDHWSEGEAFVMEFEPGKFKVVLKDGREILRDGSACEYFAKFFRNGMWKIVPEAEALARLDKPKPPMPAAEQFGPGPWYGAGLRYVYCPDGFYVYKGEAQVGWVSYEVVQHLWELGMVVTTKPEPEKPPFDITKTYESIHSGYYLVPNSYGDAFNSYRSTDHARIGTWAIDSVKDEYRLGGLRVCTKTEPEKPKKKVLVEWAVLQSPAGTYRTELWPESLTPLTGKFRTGRTIEVPE